MLLDSNIIIYSVQPNESHRQYFAQFFQVARVLPISQAILDQAVALRQRQRMTLGDAIIAGTALAYNFTLVTRNTEDFQWIGELSLLNPLG